MLFPTITFALFFAVVLPVSWLLMPQRVRWRVFMVAASWFFYGAWEARFVLLLAASTLGNQLVAALISHAPDGRARRRRLAVAVAGNLGVLAWFKYSGFFLDNTWSLLRVLGIEGEPPAIDVVLPVGISFFTFQALSYVIDVYRDRIRPTQMLDFAVYLSFFPQLVAGPIVRAGEFLPQLRHRRDARRVDASLAFWLITAGLFKKVVVASYLATEIVDPLFALPFQHGGFEALVGIYAYAIQIYADFSGYTDIAIGVALLLGFRFPQNFDAPYSATSLQDFWRRWHMTLSRWLHDYLYVPLGGNRGGSRRTYRNVMLTMLLGGLWHGAAWTFVAWGALHGAGLSLERWWGERRGRRRASPEPVLPTAIGQGPVDGGMGDAAAADGEAEAHGMGDPAPGSVVVAAPPRPGVAGVWVRRIVTFHVVCLGWVFFRASSFDNALDVLGRLFASSSTALNPMVVVAIAALLASQLVPRRVAATAQAGFSRWPPLAQAIALALGLTVIDVLGPEGVAPFIYFQF